eukprot:7851664-Lingulodinium_polyedra.AAC.1
MGLAMDVGLAQGCGWRGLSFRRPLRPWRSEIGCFRLVLPKAMKCTEIFGVKGSWEDGVCWVGEVCGVAGACWVHEVGWIDGVSWAM